MFDLASSHFAKRRYGHFLVRCGVTQLGQILAASQASQHLQTKGLPIAFLMVKLPIAMLVHIVIGLIYIGLPLVSVAALAPEESTEFDGQSVRDFALQAPDGAMVGLRNCRGCPV